jgi:hypothetical protein
MPTNSIRQLLTRAQTQYFVPLTLGPFILVLLTVSCQIDQAQPTLPPDGQLLAEVDLSTRSHDAEILGEIVLAETAVVSIFYNLPNADTPYFDLSLIGPEDENRVILHSEGYRTDESGGGSWEQNLQPGTYRLALTANPGSGVLSVYWEIPEPSRE